MKEEKNINKILKLSFWLGIASIFLNFIGLIPLVGLGLSVYASVFFDKNKHGPLWMLITAIILNMMFYTVNMRMYGHL